MAEDNGYSEKQREAVNQLVNALSPRPVTVAPSQHVPVPHSKPPHHEAKSLPAVKFDPTFEGSPTCQEILPNGHTRNLGPDCKTPAL